MKLAIGTGFTFVIGMAVISHAKAGIQPDKIHVADTKKNRSYISEGLFIGGDHSIEDAAIKDIRWASNPGFERIVIDLESSKNGENQVQQLPYYQTSVLSSKKRIEVTLWGHPKLNFDPKKVTDSFKRSLLIQSLVLLPKMEENSWTFALQLKSDTPIEVFELTHPMRLILDLQLKKN